MRFLVAIGLLAVAIAAAVGLGARAIGWNDELALTSPLAAVAPRVDDPHTPRLARRVVLVIIDGLGADESQLAFLGELRPGDVVLVKAAHSAGLERVALALTGEAAQ